MAVIVPRRQSSRNHSQWSFSLIQTARSNQNGSQKARTPSTAKSVARFVSPLTQRHNVRLTFWRFAHSFSKFWERFEQCRWSIQHCPRLVFILLSKISETSSYVLDTIEEDSRQELATQTHSHSENAVLSIGSSKSPQRVYISLMISDCLKHKMSSRRDQNFYSFCSHAIACENIPSKRRYEVNYFALRDVAYYSINRYFRRQDILHWWQQLYSYAPWWALP